MRREGGSEKGMEGAREEGREIRREGGKRIVRRYYYVCDRNNYPRHLLSITTK